MAGFIRARKITLTLTISAMLEKALEFMPGAWLLAESASGAIFAPLKPDMDPDRLLPCESIFVFNAQAELRLEKKAGESEGLCNAVFPASRGIEYAIRQLASVARRDDSRNQ